MVMVSQSTKAALFWGLASCLFGCSAFVPFQAPLSFSSSSRLLAVKQDVPEEADVIVIGSGLAGLSCAALLSHYGKSVVVLESHDAPGGAAHSWTRRGFHFDSGPSLFSGFSMDRSPNPLKNIFQIVEEDCEWITYDRWGTVLPSGKRFAAKIGPEEFGDVLREHGGPEAEKEFAALMERMQPLSDAAQALSSLALREDPAVVMTLLKYPKALFATLKQGQALNDPFSNIMEEMNIQDKFLKNWLDMCKSPNQQPNRRIPNLPSTHASPLTLQYAFFYRACPQGEQ
jgi:phytoene dehydrogenase-like protein